MHFVPQAIVVVVLMHIYMIVAPGSDYALIMRTVGRKGRVAGILIALGFGTGALSLLVIAIFGINSLFAHYPFLMTVVRYLGAAWLFWQSLLCVFPAKETIKPKSIGTFGVGFINHFINVEMVIFYIAIMGQLSIRGISTLLQLVTALFMSVFVTLWFVLVACITDRIPDGKKVLNHIVVRLIFGALFLSSAVGLVLI